MGRRYFSKKRLLRREKFIERYRLAGLNYRGGHCYQQKRQRWLPFSECCFPSAYQCCLSNVSIYQMFPPRNGSNCGLAHPQYFLLKLCSTASSVNENRQTKCPSTRSEREWDSTSSSSPRPRLPDQIKLRVRWTADHDLTEGSLPKQTAQSYSEPTPAVFAETAISA